MPNPAQYFCLILQFMPYLVLSFDSLSYIRSPFCSLLYPVVFSSTKLLILGRGGRRNLFLCKSQKWLFFVVAAQAALTILFSLPVLSAPVPRWFPLMSGAPQSYLSTSVLWFCRVAQIRGFASEQDTQFQVTVFPLSPVKSVVCSRVHGNPFFPHFVPLSPLTAQKKR